MWCRADGRIAGYAGGASEVPKLPPHVRIPPSTSEVVGAELRARYEQGRSIRQLAEVTGYSITRVRGLLTGAGTQIRGRGRTTA